MRSCYSMIVMILLVQTSHQQDLCSQTILENIAHVVNTRMSELDIRMNHISSTLNEVVVQQNVNNIDMMLTFAQLLDETLSHHLGDKLPQLLDEKLSHHLGDTLPQLLDEKLSHHLGDKLPQLLDEKLSHHLGDTLPQLLDEKLSHHLEEKLPQLLDETLSHHLEDKLPQLLDEKLSHHLVDKLPQLLDKKLSHNLEEKLPQLLDEKLSHHLEDKMSQHIEVKLLNPLEEKFSNISGSIQDVIDKQDSTNRELMGNLSDLQDKQSSYLDDHFSVANTTLSNIESALESVKKDFATIKTVTEKIELEAITFQNIQNVTSVLTKKECPLSEGFFMSPWSQCLKVFNDQPRNWTESVSFCKSEGLVLARPYGAAGLQAYLNHRYGLSSYWIRGRGTGSSITWQPDGQAISNTSALWWPGEPANYLSTSYCLCLLTSDSEFEKHPGKPYYTCGCGIHYYHLCELIME
ncbi:unnamed protein product [Meganyctiphanes norvegica]|uniref:C-type lectin domain-containing protein n=1 Tax=Meganyctiphanes norvegica TaxID=48144 RepID=A0AAV2SLL5_MEGNR